MIRNVWSVLCRMSVENRATNNVSLIEHLERLTLYIRPEDQHKTFDLALDYVLATYWFNEDAELDRAGTVKLTVVTPQNTKHVLLEKELQIQARTFKRWFFRLRSLPIAGPGCYHIHLHVKEEEMIRWKSVAAIPLFIVYNIQEDAPMVKLPQSPGDHDVGFSVL